MMSMDFSMPISLTSRERIHLKGRAHALEPIVQVGHGGLSDAVMGELERALTAHELIKVKINDADRHARHATAEAICARTGAAAVQQVGKIVVLWRPKPEDELRPTKDETGAS
jgi:putative YhbY family RNA-binding protein